MHINTCGGQRMRGEGSWRGAMGGGGGGPPLGAGGGCVCVCVCVWGGG